MTCRHRAGDPNCSSSPQAAAQRSEAQIRARMRELEARSPNPDQYQIEEVERVGPHLVMKVKYPSCSKCSFEGSKVLVFLNATEAQALRWRRIDPHFRETVVSLSEAPSPAARFPASAEGWEDAITYAVHKNNQRQGERR